MDGMAPHDLQDVHAESRGCWPAITYADTMHREIAAYQRSLLEEAIEAGVIPRLMRLKSTRDARPSIETKDIEAFARDLVTTSPDAAQAVITDLHARGWSTEAIYLDLFAPAAECLGQGWKDDTLDFADVTLGIGRLQKLVREISVGPPPRRHEAAPPKRILLATLRSEQHTFGLTLLREFFEQAGWDTQVSARISAAGLAAQVRANWFEVVGLSAATDAQARLLAPAIRAIRSVSRNSAIGILAGGGAFLANPGLAAAIGADGTASDAREAVRQAGRLLAQPVQFA